MIFSVGRPRDISLGNRVSNIDADVWAALVGNSYDVLPDARAWAESADDVSQPEAPQSIHLEIARFSESHVR